MDRVSQFQSLLRSWTSHGLERRQFLRLVSMGATAAAVSTVLGANGNLKAAAAALEQSLVSSGRKLQVERSDRTLTVGTLSEPDGVDAQDSTGNAAIAIQYCVYEGLVGLDAELKIEGQIAESWEVSDDAREFTFVLNDGVTFHDGSACDANAVKASFDRVLNPDSGLRRHGFFSPFLESVSVVDEKTVLVTAKMPFAPMIASLAHPAGAIVPAEIADAAGEDFASNPVGTGPYKFSSWQRGSHIELVAYDEYWNDERAARVSTIKVQTISDPAALAIAIQANQVQFAGPLNAPQAEQVRNTEGVELLENENIQVRWVTLNNTMAPFDNKLVRQALNHAVDKEQVLQLAELGQGWIMDAPIAPAVFGYASIGTYEPDIDKAKALLAEAGYPDGFTAELRIAASDRTRAVALQAQLDAVGVKVEINQMEDALLSEESNRGPDTSTNQMLISGWSPSTADADWGLRPIYTKDQFAPEGSNRSFYTNPEVEELIVQGLEVLDEEERAGVYAAAQEIIMDDAPNIFLYAPRYFSGIREDVEGVSTTQIGVVFMRTAAFTA